MQQPCGTGKAPAASDRGEDLKLIECGLGLHVLSIPWMLSIDISPVFSMDVDADIAAV